MFIQFKFCFDAIGRAMMAPRRVSLIAAGWMVVAMFLPPVDAAEPEFFPDFFPGAPQVLPADTLAYVRLDDVEQIRQSWPDTSLGKMFADPKLRPWLGDTYQLIAQWFESIDEEMSVSLDQLLAIPHGQVAIAILPRRVGEQTGDDSSTNDQDVQPKDESEQAIRRRLRNKRRRNASFSAVFIIDAGENLDDLRSTIERLTANMERSNWFVRRQSQVEQIELNQMVPAKSGRRQPLQYFVAGTTMVIGVGEKTASGVLDQCIGRGDEPTLADDGDFVTLISRCLGEEQTRPQATLFIDPAMIVERLMRRNMTSAMVIPMVQTLGLQRLRGIAASSFRGGDFFEDITHVHIGIDPPRDGVFGLVRPSDGPTMPPRWVPADVASYTTLHWRFDVALKNAESFIGTFTGGKTIDEAMIGPAEDWSGISIRDEFLPQLTGRYCLLRRVPDPVRPGGMVLTHGLQVKQAAEMVSMLERVRERRPNNVVLETISGINAYQFAIGGDQTNSGWLDDSNRPYLFILGDWLMLTRGKTSAEDLIATHRDLQPSLATKLSYEQVAGELSGMLGGEEPFAMSYVRPEESVRLAYQWVLAQAKPFRTGGKRTGGKPIGDGNGRDDDETSWPDRFRAAAANHELPTFDELKKYFAPSGSFMYDEPGGVHFAAYTLRSSE